MGVDLEWRRLDFPANTNNNLRTMAGTCSSLKADEKCFVVRFYDTCEIACLGAGSEMIVSIKVPRECNKILRWDDYFTMEQ